MSSASSLAPGARVGPCEVLTLLSEGGMQVYGYVRRMGDLYLTSR